MLISVHSRLRAACALLLSVQLPGLMVAQQTSASSTYHSEGDDDSGWRQALHHEKESNQEEVKRYGGESYDDGGHDREELIELLRKRVKYVFVFYQENRSFDSYFGTFPGAEGIFSHSPSKTPGFYQTFTDTNGKPVTISPFRIGPDQYAADTDDVDHSHPRMVAKMDIKNGVPQMDQFAAVEEAKYTTGATPSLKAKQFGELTMAYEDCDTVPFLWRYANRFVLYDHIFQYFTGPSTPGNIAIIAAQSGETQWALHPSEAYTGNGGSGPGVPVANDADPFWGSQKDATAAGEKLPANPPAATPQLNLTFASLPLTLMGGDLSNVTQTDRDPGNDLADVQQDVNFITNLGHRTVPFGWYEEGFDLESTDNQSGPITADGSHASYITHHNGPQYFGYIANNPQMTQNLHGLGDFFTAVSDKTLPKEGGVFWVKGGLANTFNLSPVDPDPAVQKNFKGDDDHPAYSDAQISEAMVAEGVNRIAASPYWPESAIVITWDDSEGDYDHVRPPVRSFGPDGSVITEGPRVPLILISPFSKTNYISKGAGTQVSVVKLINQVFSLPPLATLPDEERGLFLGFKNLKQSHLGPQDGPDSAITDLLDGFSAARLSGRLAPLPASYVHIPERLITNLPQKTGYGCSALGIIPTDQLRGIQTVIPADFNPRPNTLPTPIQ